MSHVAPDAKLSGARATLVFGGGVMYIWHALSASEVLAEAIGCIGFGLYHVARFALLCETQNCFARAWSI